MMKVADVLSQSNDDRQQIGRAEWVTPQLSRLSAGSAENADQTGSDDGINLAS